MDISLYSVEQGSGEPLVLLHGNGEDSSYFQRQMEYFSREYRVIAVDTRGHGQSPRGEKPFTLPQFAEDLKGFMDENKIEKAHILGFSDGGNIALLFALRYPEMVGKLILNGANLSPAGVKRTYQIPIIIGYGIVSAISAFDKGATAKKELLGLMVTQPDISPSELSTLPTPTLVIAGTRDMIKTSHTRLIASSIPGAKLCLLEGGHFIAAKSPRAFNEAVLNFLHEQPEISQYNKG